MPTDIDLKLSEDLADFRLATEKRFGTMAEDMAGIREQLKFIRWIGVFFAGVLTTLVAAAISLSWSASAVVKDVQYQGARLDKIEGRLDVMSKQLETLISRTTPKG